MPTEAELWTDPGTAPTSIPRRKAASTVCHDPPLAWDSTTTTMRAKPAMSRLRDGKRHACAGHPGGVSDTTAPSATTSRQSASCRRGYDHVDPARGHPDRRAGGRAARPCPFCGRARPPARRHERHRRSRAPAPIRRRPRRWTGRRPAGRRPSPRRGCIAGCRSTATHGLPSSATEPSGGEEHASSLGATGEGRRVPRCPGPGDRDAAALATGPQRARRLCAEPPRPTPGPTGLAGPSRGERAPRRPPTPRLAVAGSGQGHRRAMPARRLAGTPEQRRRLPPATRSGHGRPLTVAPARASG